MEVESESTIKAAFAKAGKFFCDPRHTQAYERVGETNGCSPIIKELAQRNLQGFMHERRIYRQLTNGLTTEVLGEGALKNYTHKPVNQQALVWWPSSIPAG